MKEKLKGTRASQFVMAIVALIIGILCVIFPNSAADIVVRVIGVVIIIVGIVMIVSRLTDYSLRIPAIILGAIIAAIGIYIAVNPGKAISIFNIAFGVLILADAIQQITASMAIREVGGAWTVAFILSLVSLVLGIICIVAPHFWPTMGFFLIGLMLIYDGVTSFISAFRATKAEKGVIDSDIVDEEDI